MNVAVRLLTALALVTLVGCGGDEDAKGSGSPKAADTAKSADSTPLAERVLTVQDVPGSKPDPAEVRQTPANLDESVNVFANFANAPDLKEITDAFKEAGVEGAVLDSRYIGKIHSGTAPHAIGLVVQTKSDQAATSMLDFLEADLKKPCPNSCAVKATDFQVDAIPGARGVHTSASAKDIEKIGTSDQKPFDGYWVAFTDGPYATSLELRGPPGSVSEEQAVKIATTYYERVTSN